MAKVELDEVRRIPLPRTLVNKAEEGASAGCLMSLGNGSRALTRRGEGVSISTHFEVFLPEPEYSSLLWELSGKFPRTPSR